MEHRHEQIRRRDAQKIRLGFILGRDAGDVDRVKVKPSVIAHGFPHVVLICPLQPVPIAGGKRIDLERIQIPQGYPERGMSRLHLQNAGFLGERLAKSEHQMLYLLHGITPLLPGTALPP